MQIEHIRIRNFRAFKEVELAAIPPLAILVGANGMGKSTLFAIFGFLRDAMNTNVRTALAKLGGSRGFRAYLTLLYDPAPHPLLGVEEPETSSIPSYCTNSPRSSGPTPIGAGRCSYPRTRRTSSMPPRSTRCFCFEKAAATPESSAPETIRSFRAYMADGDKMGQLWKQGSFKGVDP